MTKNKEILNNTALIFIINHMHFGGCQKIVYEIINGNRYPGDVYLIGNSGHYSTLLEETKNVNFIDRTGMSFFKTMSVIRQLKSRYKRTLLHTHNRKDIALKYGLRNSDVHLHTFHSAYLDKNYLYRFLKPQNAVSISKTVQTYLSSHGIKNRLIYNGVNIEVPSFKSNQEVTLQHPKLLFVGRLSEEKGILQLIKAMSEWATTTNKNISFDIVGDGILLKACEAFIKAHPRKNLDITFKGYSEDPWKDINHYDLLVIPSVFEGFCLVGAEAAARGIPIIGSDILALREVLWFLPSSYFFNPQKIDSISSCLQQAIYNNEHTLKLMQENKAAVKRKFSVEEMINNYNETFENLLS